ncbi:MAG: zinc finger domain-containing protein [Candidatus Kariarchaeaceae archaeon]
MKRSSNPRPCPKCKGRGVIIKNKQSCDKCAGLGQTKLVLGSGSSGSNSECEACGGRGYILIKEECPLCLGKKQIETCFFCNQLITDENRGTGDLCKMCEEEATVLKLRYPYDQKLIDRGMVFVGRINNFSKFGTFISISPSTNVLIRPQDEEMIKAKEMGVGDEVIVKIINSPEIGKYQGIPIEITNYKVKSIRRNIPLTRIKDSYRLREGSDIAVKGEVTHEHVNFDFPSYEISDETGTIKASSLSKEGRRVIKDLKKGEVVTIFGKAVRHRGETQIEILDLDTITGKQEEEVKEKISQAIDEKAKIKTEDLLIKTEKLEKLKEEITKAAFEIRKAVIRGHPISIRHHADPDGVCGSLALYVAIRQYMKNVGIGSQTVNHRVRRLPTVTPYIELSDAIRDIDASMQNRSRFGEKLPMMVYVDLGSSQENIKAMEMLNHFDIKPVVVDHHPLVEKIKELTAVVVNPYLGTEEYSITSGMLSVEIARMIAPKTVEKYLYLAPVSGITDHVKGEELEKYLELTKEKIGLTKDELVNIGLAIDLTNYSLRYSSGDELLSEMVGIKGLTTESKELVMLVAEEAKRNKEKAIKLALENIQKEEFEEKNIIIIELDTEKHTQRYAYPSSGTIVGGVHDKHVTENEEKGVVTIGKGSGLIIFRSKKIKLVFREMIEKLKEIKPEAGITGGGHEQVGSFRYLIGHEKEVIAELKKLILEYDLE